MLLKMIESKKSVSYAALIGEGFNVQYVKVADSRWALWCVVLPGHDRRAMRPLARQFSATFSSMRSCDNPTTYLWPGTTYRHAAKEDGAVCVRVVKLGYPSPRVTRGWRATSTCRNSYQYLFDKRLILVYPNRHNYHGVAFINSFPVVLQAPTVICLGGTVDGGASHLISESSQQRIQCRIQ